MFKYFNRPRWCKLNFYDTILNVCRWNPHLWSKYAFTKPNYTTSGLILHGGNLGDCLRVTWSLPWCPWNAPVEICNFITGCPLPRRKCLGALALSKTKHTGLQFSLKKCFVYFFLVMKPRMPHKWTNHCSSQAWINLEAKAAEKCFFFVDVGIWGWSSFSSKHWCLNHFLVTL